MSVPEPIIRPLSPADVSRCVELSTEAHWNQTGEDWRFLIADAHTYGLELPGQGLVATTVAWDLSPEMSWINMVLVTPSARGQGFARVLLQQALAEAAGRGRIPALDATRFGVPVYERLGFAGEKQLVRLTGTAGIGAPGREGPRQIRPLGPDDLVAVIAADAAILGANRGTMIRAWRERLPEAAWCGRDSSGKLTGYLLGRSGRSATQLGPLGADTVETARALLAAAREAVAGPLIIDVPAGHAALITTLERGGFREERDFRRMGLAGRLPATDWSRYFAAAGPDFA